MYLPVAVPSPCYRLRKPSQGPGDGHTGDRLKQAQSAGRLLDQWSARAAYSVWAMSNSYPIEPLAAPSKVRITAGTAFKLGFFGALGIFVFYLIISIIFGIVAAIALAAGLLPTLPQLLQGF